MFKTNNVTLYFSRNLFPMRIIGILKEKDEKEEKSLIKNLLHRN